MENKKQTAVEWLVEQINQDYPEMTWAYKDECEQAKAMEKEQIIEAHNIGRNDKHNDFDREGEQYYNQTYGQ
jgi:hypothetical protein